MVRVAYSQWFMAYAYLQIDSPYQIYWHQTKYQPYEIPAVSSQCRPTLRSNIPSNHSNGMWQAVSWTPKIVCAFKLTIVAVYHLGITNTQDAWQEPFKILNKLFQINANVECSAPAGLTRCCWSNSHENTSNQTHVHHYLFQGHKPDTPGSTSSFYWLPRLSDL